MDVLPLALALAAAFFFGIMVIFSKRGMAYVDAQTGSMIAIGVPALLYLAAAPLWMRAEDWFTPGFWIFLVNGLFHPTLSMYLSYEATHRIGPTVSATFSATTPLFASLMAMVALGETVGLAHGVGTLLTVAGVMVLSWQRGSGASLARSALAFATGAALVRGLNQNVGKAGLRLLPNPFMAAWVSFTLAFALSLLGYRIRKGTFPLRIPLPGLVYCSIGGVCIAAAILLMYGALNVGDVVLVTPIVAAYPVFTLLAAFLFKQERLSVRTVLGVSITVLGVVLISVARGL